jgi:hypothetical protein
MNARTTRPVPTPAYVPSRRPAWLPFAAALAILVVVGAAYAFWPTLRRGDQPATPGTGPGLVTKVESLYNDIYLYRQANGNYLLSFGAKRLRYVESIVNPNDELELPVYYTQSMTAGLAYAAGLGRLTIASTLGQPLVAEVELVSVQEHEVAALKVRIASPEAYTKANVQYSPALLGVRLSIERRSDGRPYVKIISTRPVNEPFIDLLVELSWPQGHLVREYTALIDPPGYTPGAPIVQVVPPVVPAPAVTLESQAPASTAPVEVKPAAKAPAVNTARARPSRPFAAALDRAPEWKERLDSVSWCRVNAR